MRRRRLRAAARLSMATVAVPLGFAVSSFLGVSTATASGIGNAGCPHNTGQANGGNYGSTACLLNVAQSGDYTEIHNSTMDFIGAYGTQLEDEGWHINHTLWAYSGAPCGTDWVEIGDTQGNGPGSPPVYSPGYFYYYAYNNATGYHGHIIGASDNTGTNHTYQMSWLGGANYEVYLDEGAAGAANGQGAGSCTGQAGEELSGNDYGAGDDNLAYQHSDTFENYPLEYEDFSHVWHTGWNTGEYWVDNPCGQPGYATPNCLNIQFPNNNQLYTNKP
jgi:hypothetical protein